ncbi:MAG: long-chain fatty acid--CoA ligase [Anaerolineae bacterium]|nr:long-chain fatty acid--CoA ligase [Caldilineales bacterium]MDW8269641.1 long-chain fatty acid--CoA ligase [Anaerolineae bacterium]
MPDKPWLKNYDPGVRPSLQPYPRKTLVDVVHESARERPQHPALWFKGHTLSYGELDRLSDAFAAGLVRLGVRKGDRVAIMMPNAPQYVIAELGIWKAGGIVASINPLYTGAELEHMFKECDAETVVTLSLFYDKVKEVQSRTPLRRVIVANIKEYLPPVLRLLFTLVKEKKEGHRVTLRDGDLAFQDVLRQNQGAARPQVDVQPEDPALILFTGGTTGLSKAAVGSHHALVISGLQITEWFKNVLHDWEDVFLTSLPLFHVFAAAGVQTAALLSHNTMVLVPNPRDLTDVIETIQKAKATFVPGVPTFYVGLLSHPLVKEGKADLTSIKLCISGASALLQETKERFEALAKCRIVEGYALTESMMAIVCTPVNGKYKVGSVGMPVSDVEARIVDAETGQRDLPPGEVGEIILRAPQLMLGYWRRPEATAEMIRDGWLYTADLGYMDEDGYIFIVDRKKDVIKPSGFQVWPREVEEVIAKHPAVAEVGVAGVPDERTTEAVKAWIVLREGHTATAEEIKEFCRQHLAAYKVPKHVEFRTALPKSAVGKVLRRELSKGG